MIIPDKYSAFELWRLMSEYGVDTVVISPGSRNAPIVEMLSSSGYRLIPVIDERSAAFIALGIALSTGRPVALVCTSGTALLNYAPAIAEAYYRQVPLIVVSADRPAEWIDQDDSQTLRQPGALANIVKQSYDLPDVGLYSDDNDLKWAIRRNIADALLKATDPLRKGPVHINMQMREPLGRKVEYRRDDWPEIRPISMMRPTELDEEAIKEIIAEISSFNRILIVGAGLAASSNRGLTGSLRLLSGMLQVALSVEPLSNVDAPGFSYMAAEGRDELVPELVISFGGAVVDKALKLMLRHAKGKIQHWMVGTRERVADPFMCITRRIEVEPHRFFKMLAANLEPRNDAQYRSDWEKRRAECVSLPDTFLVSAINAAPGEGRCNLVISNGYTLRQVLRIPGLAGKFASIDCNRGVSGIEGSTSTAVGWQIGDKERTTLLVTGDMSFAYDIGALASRQITPRLKIIVNNNGGGEIFRHIESTAQSPVLDDYFVCAPKLPLRQLAEAYGFAYYTKGQEDAFYADKMNPAILEIVED